MARTLSPLRYPGGKSKIYERVKNLIEINALTDRTYVEPFAGGFGIGIKLLCDNIVQTAILNDYDSHIYNFWLSVLYHTDDLLRMINDTPVTLGERDRQKAVYMDDDADEVSDGFATLFLNRVNFSGIIKGGPLGGLSQSGIYKIDCRFNKVDIANKIQQIALFNNRIELYNYDASKLITEHLNGRIHTSFFNIDPPYVEKGPELYTNYFKEEDHKYLERTITENLGETKWIVTYDDCDLIHNIYKDYHKVEYNIRHNAGGSILGKEIVITNIPESSFIW